jgi:hypothetical protein
MIHDSTWLGRTRAWRGARTAAPLVFVLGCVLLVLAGFASVASASSPEMRGEWEIVLKAGVQTNIGKTVIRQEAGAKGEFASEAVQFQQGSPGTFEGTLEGSTAKVKITTSTSGSVPSTEFESETMTVTSGVSSLEISGEGTFTVPSFKVKMTGMVVATRIKTYKEVEEREARELREKEEKEAREAVRGEWALTLEYGKTVKGTAFVTTEANAKNEFASSGALFESVVGGTFSGTLEGKEASLRVTTEASGPYPATTFTGTKITVTSTSNSMSMTGAGTFSAAGNSIPATITATRVKTYQEVVARERAEAEAKEKQEQEAQEAKEKTEREAKEKGERETKEKREREAREAVEKANKIAPPSSLPLVTPPAPMPVVVATKTFMVPSSGGLSLKLTNPNGAAATGQLKITSTIKVASAKHRGRAKSKTITLGEASFSLAGNGTQTVKIVLSHSARGELAHLKTMHALIALTTETGGKQAGAATYKLTLSAPAHRKG